MLTAAARVFARNGFHATSLDAIGEAAGFSRGAVYYNFADKEELFLELLDRRCAERARDIRDVFAGADEDDVASDNRAGPARRRARAGGDDRRSPSGARSTSSSSRTPPATKRSGGAFAQAHRRHARTHSRMSWSSERPGCRTRSACPRSSSRS